jgi:8-amino-7-oxononanoate synthase
MRPKNHKIIQENPGPAITGGWLKALHQDLFDKNRLKKFPEGLYRSLSNNDYLGLSHHQEVISSSIYTINKYGIGATGSRFLSGNHQLNAELEERIAEFKALGNAHGIVFSSGYHANVSIMSVLGELSSAIYSDKDNHASLIDGLRLVNTPIFIYPHNDWHWVKDHLTKHRPKKPIIITESLFSMEGDLAPVKDLYGLCQRFGGILVIDDAHGTGTLGRTGRGVLEEYQLEFDPDCMIITGTFSKALGSLGGFAILGEKEREIITSLARPFIYTTALPPGILGASLSALQTLKNNPYLVHNLQEKSIFWNRTLLDKNFAVPIISIIEDLDHLEALSKSFEMKGFALPIIKYPTVPVGAERLRLSVNLDWDSATTNAILETFGISGSSR